jgi:uncharacterized peroxidase-related enzyme
MSYLREEPLDEKNYPPFADVKGAFGFVPNLYKAQTMRPDLIEKEIALVGQILITEGALTRKQKEYVFLVCSAANLSTYCVTAHCEIVKMLKIQGPEPELVALDHNTTDIPVRDKALLNFALKLNNQTTKIGKADVDGLKTYGFKDEHILETVVLVGLAKFANTLGFGLGTHPDFRAVDLTLRQKAASAASPASSAPAPRPGAAEA